MLITGEMHYLNSRLHETNPDYGANGVRFMDVVYPTLKAFSTASGKIDNLSVLDYGCGKNSLMTAISVSEPSWKLVGYDPCVPEFSARPERKFDAVVCTDVLEHVELESLHDVLLDIHQFAKYLVVFTVNITKAKKTYEDGRNTHINIKGLNWWIKKLISYSNFYNASVIEHNRTVIGLSYVGIPYGASDT